MDNYNEPKRNNTNNKPISAHINPTLASSMMTNISTPSGSESDLVSPAGIVLDFHNGTQQSMTYVADTTRNSSSTISNQQGNNHHDTIRPFSPLNSSFSQYPHLYSPPSTISRISSPIRGGNHAVYNNPSISRLPMSPLRPPPFSPIYNDDTIENNNRFITSSSPFRPSPSRRNNGNINDINKRNNQYNSSITDKQNNNDAYRDPNAQSSYKPIVLSDNNQFLNPSINISPKIPHNVSPSHSNSISPVTPHISLLWLLYNSRIHLHSASLTYIPRIVLNTGYLLCMSRNYIHTVSILSSRIMIQWNRLEKTIKMTGSGDTSLSTTDNNHNIIYNTTNNTMNKYTRQISQSSLPLSHYLLSENIKQGQDISQRPDLLNFKQFINDMTQYNAFMKKNTNNDNNNNISEKNNNNIIARNDKNINQQNMKNQSLSSLINTINSTLFNGTSLPSFLPHHIENEMLKYNSQTLQNDDFNSSNSNHNHINNNNNSNSNNINHHDTTIHDRVGFLSASKCLLLDTVHQIVTVDIDLYNPNVVQYIIDSIQEKCSICCPTCISVKGNEILHIENNDNMNNINNTKANTDNDNIVDKHHVKMEKSNLLHTQYSDYLDKNKVSYTSSSSSSSSSSFSPLSLPTFISLEITTSNLSSTSLFSSLEASRLEFNHSIESLSDNIKSKSTKTSSDIDINNNNNNIDHTTNRRGNSDTKIDHVGRGSVKGIKNHKRREYNEIISQNLNEMNNYKKHTGDIENNAINKKQYTQETSSSSSQSYSLSYDDDDFDNDQQHNYKDIDKRYDSKATLSSKDKKEDIRDSYYHINDISPQFDSISGLKLDPVMMSNLFIPAMPRAQSGNQSHDSQLNTNTNNNKHTLPQLFPDYPQGSILPYGSHSTSSSSSHSSNEDNEFFSSICSLSFPTGARLNLTTVHHTKPSHHQFILTDTDGTLSYCYVLTTWTHIPIHAYCHARNDYINRKQQQQQQQQSLNTKNNMNTTTTQQSQNNMIKNIKYDNGIISNDTISNILPTISNYQEIYIAIPHCTVMVGKKNAEPLYFSLLLHIYKSLYKQNIISYKNAFKYGIRSGNFIEFLLGLSPSSSSSSSSSSSCSDVSPDNQQNGRHSVSNSILIRDILPPCDILYTPLVNRHLCSIPSYFPGLILPILSMVCLQVVLNPSLPVSLSDGQIGYILHGTRHVSTAIEKYQTKVVKRLNTEMNALNVIGYNKKRKYEPIRSATSYLTSIVRHGSNDQNNMDNNIPKSDKDDISSINSLLSPQKGHKNRVDDQKQPPSTNTSSSHSTQDSTNEHDDDDLVYITTPSPLLLLFSRLASLPSQMAGHIRPLVHPIQTERLVRYNIIQNTIYNSYISLDKSSKRRDRYTATGYKSRSQQWNDNDKYSHNNSRYSSDHKNQCSLSISLDLYYQWLTYDKYKSSYNINDLVPLNDTILTSMDLGSSYYPIIMGPPQGSFFDDNNRPGRATISNSSSSPFTSNRNMLSSSHDTSNSHKSTYMMSNILLNTLNTLINTSLSFSTSNIIKKQCDVIYNESVYTQYIKDIFYSKNDDKYIDKTDNNSILDPILSSSSSSSSSSSCSSYNLMNNQLVAPSSQINTISPYRIDTSTSTVDSYDPLELTSSHRRSSSSLLNYANSYRTSDSKGDENRERRSSTGGYSTEDYADLKLTEELTSHINNAIHKDDEAIRGKMKNRYPIINHHDMYNTSSSHKQNFIIKDVISVDVISDFMPYLSSIYQSSKQSSSSSSIAPLISSIESQSNSDNTTTANNDSTNLSILSDTFGLVGTPNLSNLTSKQRSRVVKDNTNDNETFFLEPVDNATINKESSTEYLAKIWSIQSGLPVSKSNASRAPFSSLSLHSILSCTIPIDSIAKLSHGYRHNDLQSVHRYHIDSTHHKTDHIKSPTILPDNSTRSYEPPKSIFYTSKDNGMQRLQMASQASSSSSSSSSPISPQMILPHHILSSLTSHMLSHLSISAVNTVGPAHPGTTVTPQSSLLLLSPLLISFLIDSIFQQRQIVVVSIDPNIVYNVSTALMLLVQPLPFVLPFIPILPHNMLEILEAPQPYLTGIVLPSSSSTTTFNTTSSSSSSSNEGIIKDGPCSIYDRIPPTTIVLDVDKHSIRLPTIPGEDALADLCPQTRQKLWVLTQLAAFDGNYDSLIDDNNDNNTNNNVDSKDSNETQNKTSISKQSRIAKRLREWAYTSPTVLLHSTDAMCAIESYQFWLNNDKDGLDYLSMIENSIDLDRIIDENNTLAHDIMKYMKDLYKKKRIDKLNKKGLKKQFYNKIGRSDKISNTNQNDDINNDGDDNYNTANNNIYESLDKYHDELTNEEFNSILDKINGVTSSSLSPSLEEESKSYNNTTTSSRKRGFVTPSVYLTPYHHNFLKRSTHQRRMTLSLQSDIDNNSLDNDNISNENSLSISNTQYDDDNSIKIAENEQRNTITYNEDHGPTVQPIAPPRRIPENDSLAQNSTLYDVNTFIQAMKETDFYNNKTETSKQIPPSKFKSDDNMIDKQSNADKTSHNFNNDDYNNIEDKQNDQEKVSTTSTLYKRKIPRISQRVKFIMQFQRDILGLIIDPAWVQVPLPSYLAPSALKTSPSLTVLDFPANTHHKSIKKTQESSNISSISPFPINQSSPQLPINQNSMNELSLDDSMDILRLFEIWKRDQLNKISSKGIDSGNTDSYSNINPVSRVSEWLGISATQSKTAQHNTSPRHDKGYNSSSSYTFRKSHETTTLLDTIATILEWHQKRRSGVYYGDHILINNAQNDAQKGRYNGHIDRQGDYTNISAQTYTNKNVNMSYQSKVNTMSIDQAALSRSDALLLSLREITSINQLFSTDHNSYNAILLHHLYGPSLHTPYDKCNMTSDIYQVSTGHTNKNNSTSNDTMINNSTLNNLTQHTHGNILYTHEYNTILLSNLSSRACIILFESFPHFYLYIKYWYTSRTLYKSLTSPTLSSLYLSSSLSTLLLSSTPLYYDILSIGLESQDLYQKAYMQRCDIYNRNYKNTMTYNGVNGANQTQSDLQQSRSQQSNFQRLSQLFSWKSDDSISSEQSVKTPSKSTRNNNIYHDKSHDVSSGTTPAQRYQQNNQQNNQQEGGIATVIRLDAIGRMLLESNRHLSCDITSRIEALFSIYQKRYQITQYSLQIIQSIYNDMSILRDDINEQYISRSYNSLIDEMNTYASVVSGYYNTVYSCKSPSNEVISSSKNDDVRISNNRFNDISLISTRSLVSTRSRRDIPPLTSQNKQRKHNRRDITSDIQGYTSPISSLGFISDTYDDDYDDDDSINQIVSGAVSTARTHHDRETGGSLGIIIAPGSEFYLVEEQSPHQPHSRQEETTPQRNKHSSPAERGQNFNLSHTKYVFDAFSSDDDRDDSDNDEAEDIGNNDPYKNLAKHPSFGHHDPHFDNISISDDENASIYHNTTIIDHKNIDDDDDTILFDNTNENDHPNTSLPSKLLDNNNNNNKNNIHRKIKSDDNDIEEVVDNSPLKDESIQHHESYSSILLKVLSVIGIETTPLIVSSYKNDQVLTLIETCEDMSLYSQSQSYKNMDKVKQASYHTYVEGKQWFSLDSESNQLVWVPDQLYLDICYIQSAMKSVVVVEETCKVGTGKHPEIDPIDDVDNKTQFQAVSEMLKGEINKAVKYHKKALRALIRNSLKRDLLCIPAHQKNDDELSSHHYDDSKTKTTTTSLSTEGPTLESLQDTELSIIHSLTLFDSLYELIDDVIDDIMHCTTHITTSAPLEFLSHISGRSSRLDNLDNRVNKHHNPNENHVSNTNNSNGWSNVLPFIQITQSKTSYRHNTKADNEGNQANINIDPSCKILRDNININSPFKAPVSVPHLSEEESAVLPRILSQFISPLRCSLCGERDFIYCDDCGRQDICVTCGTSIAATSQPHSLLVDEYHKSVSSTSIPKNNNNSHIKTTGDNNKNKASSSSHYNTDNRDQLSSIRKYLSFSNDNRCNFDEFSLDCSIHCHCMEKVSSTKKSSSEYQKVWKSREKRKQLAILRLHKRQQSSSTKKLSSSPYTQFLSHITSKQGFYGLSHPELCNTSLSSDESRGKSSSSITNQLHKPMMAVEQTDTWHGVLPILLLLLGNGTITPNCNQYMTCNTLLPIDKDEVSTNAATTTANTICFCQECSPFFFSLDTAEYINIHTWQLCTSLSTLLSTYFMRGHQKSLESTALTNISLEALQTSRHKTEQMKDSFNDSATEINNNTSSDLNATFTDTHKANSPSKTINDKEGRDNQLNNTIYIHPSSTSNSIASAMIAAGGLLSTSSRPSSTRSLTLSSRNMCQRIIGSPHQNQSSMNDTYRISQAALEQYSITSPNHSNNIAYNSSIPPLISDLLTPSRQRNQFNTRNSPLKDAIDANILTPTLYKMPDNRICSKMVSPTNNNLPHSPYSALIEAMVTPRGGSTLSSMILGSPRCPLTTRSNAQTYQTKEGHKIVISPKEYDQTVDKDLGGEIVVPGQMAGHILLSPRKISPHQQSPQIQTISASSSPRILLSPTHNQPNMRSCSPFPPAINSSLGVVLSPRINHSSNTDHVMMNLLPKTRSNSPRTSQIVIPQDILINSESNLNNNNKSGYITAKPDEIMSLSQLQNELLALGNGIKGGQRYGTGYHPVTQPDKHLNIINISSYQNNQNHDSINRPLHNNIIRIHGFGVDQDTYNNEQIEPNKRGMQLYSVHNKNGLNTTQSRGFFTRPASALLDATASTASPAVSGHLQPPTMEQLLERSLPPEAETLGYENNDDGNTSNSLFQRDGSIIEEEDLIQQISRIRHIYKPLDNRNEYKNGSALGSSFNQITSTNLGEEDASKSSSPFETTLAQFVDSGPNSPVIQETTKQYKYIHDNSLVTPNHDQHGKSSLYGSNDYDNYNADSHNSCYYSQQNTSLVIYPYQCVSYYIESMLKNTICLDPTILLCIASDHINNDIALYTSTQHYIRYSEIQSNAIEYHTNEQYMHDDEHVDNDSSTATVTAQRDLNIQSGNDSKEIHNITQDKSSMIGLLSPNNAMKTSYTKDAPHNLKQKNHYNNNNNKKPDNLLKRPTVVASHVWTNIYNKRLLDYYDLSIIKRLSLSLYYLSLAKQYNFSAQVYAQAPTIMGIGIDWKPHTVRLEGSHLTWYTEKIFEKPISNTVAGTPLIGGTPLSARNPRASDTVSAIIDTDVNDGIAHDTCRIVEETSDGTTTTNKHILSASRLSSLADSLTTRLSRPSYTLPSSKPVNSQGNVPLGQLSLSQAHHTDNPRLSGQSQIKDHTAASERNIVKDQCYRIEIVPTQTVCGLVQFPTPLTPSRPLDSSNEQLGLPSPFNTNGPLGTPQLGAQFYLQSHTMSGSSSFGTSSTTSSLTSSLLSDDATAIYKHSHYGVRGTFYPFSCTNNITTDSAIYIETILNKYTYYSTKYGNPTPYCVLVVSPWVEPTSDEDIHEEDNVKQDNPTSIYSTKHSLNLSSNILDRNTENNINSDNNPAIISSSSTKMNMNGSTNGGMKSKSWLDKLYWVKPSTSNLYPNTIKTSELSHFQRARVVQGASENGGSTYGKYDTIPSTPITNNNMKTSSLSSSVLNNSPKSISRNHNIKSKSTDNNTNDTNNISYEELYMKEILNKHRHCLIYFNTSQEAISFLTCIYSRTTRQIHDTHELLQPYKNMMYNLYNDEIYGFTHLFEPSCYGADVTLACHSIRDNINQDRIVSKSAIDEKQTVHDNDVTQSKTDINNTIHTHKTTLKEENIRADVTKLDQCDIKPSHLPKNHIIDQRMLAETNCQDETIIKKQPSIVESVDDNGIDIKEKSELPVLPMPTFDIPCTGTNTSESSFFTFQDAEPISDIVYEHYTKKEINRNEIDDKNDSDDTNESGRHGYHKESLYDSINDIDTVGSNTGGSFNDNTSEQNMLISPCQNKKTPTRSTAASTQENNINSTFDTKLDMETDGEMLISPTSNERNLTQVSKNETHIEEEKQTNSYQPPPGEYVKPDTMKSSRQGRIARVIPHLASSTRSIPSKRNEDSVSASEKLKMKSPQSKETTSSTTLNLPTPIQTAKINKSGPSSLRESDSSLPLPLSTAAKDIDHQQHPSRLNRTFIDNSKGELPLPRRLSNNQGEIASHSAKVKDSTGDKSLIPNRLSNTSNSFSNREERVIPNRLSHTRRNNSLGSNQENDKTSTTTGGVENQLDHIKERIRQANILKSRQIQLRTPFVMPHEDDKGTIMKGFGKIKTNSYRNQSSISEENEVEDCDDDNELLPLSDKINLRDVAPPTSGSHSLPTPIMHNPRSNSNISSNTNTSATSKQTPPSGVPSSSQQRPGARLSKNSSPETSESSKSANEGRSARAPRYNPNDPTGLRQGNGGTLRTIRKVRGHQQSSSKDDQ